MLKTPLRCSSFGLNYSTTLGCFSLHFALFFLLFPFQNSTLREGYGIEAARRCGVCDKTIRRAIHMGKLPARFVHSNRCEIAVSDLERFMPGQSPGQVQATAIESRIEELERRIQVLEQRVLDLLNRPEPVTSRRPSQRAKRTTGPLPRTLVSLVSFTQLHSVAETRVLAHVDISLLPAQRGEWTDRDGSLVTLALDAKGRQAFYQLYREVPSFLRCEQCPHG